MEINTLWESDTHVLQARLWCGGSNLQLRKRNRRGNGTRIVVSLDTSPRPSSAYFYDFAQRCQDVCPNAKTLMETIVNY